MKKLVCLTGAGMSAESGISTFRDANGLWENHDIMDVASLQGWHKNPQLVLDFYNARRFQLDEVEPNLGHTILAELQEHFQVEIITQNVDDLHERAGSQNVLHLHGELRKICSERNKNLRYNWENKLQIGDCAEDNAQLRPFIVWFGEDVPMMEHAISICSEADLCLIIGTSLQVYPAASLIDYIPNKAEIFYIDTNPTSFPTTKNIHVMTKTASEGLLQWKNNTLKKN